MSWGWVPVNPTRLKPEIFFKTFKNHCGAVEIPGSATQKCQKFLQFSSQKNYWRNHMKLKKKRCCIAVSCFKNWFVFNFSVGILHRRGSSKNAAYFFSRHIEVYLYNAKLNQTSRKPKISPQIAVTAGFQVTIAACENFAGSTGDLKTSYHS